MDTTVPTPVPPGIVAPQVGTDAIATLVRLSRRLYLSTICTGKEGSMSLTADAYTPCYEPPLTREEDDEFRRALDQADRETWDYSVYGLMSAVPDSPVPS